MSGKARIAVIGMGAIGGWVAASLAKAGYPVGAVARHETLKALQSHGVRLTDASGAHAYPVTAVADPEDLGPQDYVIIAVKGPALAAAARAVPALLGPHTAVVTMMNGVPWWFLADRDPEPLRSIDPDGEIARHIPFERVIGCVVHGTAATQGPADVVHKMGHELILGEPRGDQSGRLSVIAQALREAGFTIKESQNIQYDIWYKLWGNMTMNPISAISGATCDKILDDDLVRAFIQRAMAEASRIGAEIGCPIAQTPEDRNQVTRKLGAFKTSMLQDVEAGRAVELDALLAAPREIAARIGVATPNMDTLFGLARLFFRERGLYPR